MQQRSSGQNEDGGKENQGREIPPALAGFAMMGHGRVLDHEKTPHCRSTTVGGSKSNPGNDLLFHTVASAVPSALEGLTTVFGMRTGVTPPLRPPGIFISGSV